MSAATVLSVAVFIIQNNFVNKKVDFYFFLLYNNVVTKL